ncbi:hypothetical protein GGP69_003349 [Salinibacter ruber]|nr:hypothetical protein [Salinibacter ruber]
MHGRPHERGDSSCQAICLKSLLRVASHTRGQTAERQINCLEGVGAALGNEREDLSRMEDGYTLASDAGLRRVGEQLRRMSATEKDRLRGRLQVGVQQETEVTLSREAALSEEAAPPEAGRDPKRETGGRLDRVPDPSGRGRVREPSGVDHQRDPAGLERLQGMSP